VLLLVLFFHFIYQFLKKRLVGGFTLNIFALWELLTILIEEPHPSGWGRPSMVTVYDLCGDAAIHAVPPA
jgi:hypothetical protein